MSRIGKKPIALPKGVSVKIAADAVEVQGPKGKLRQPLPPGIVFAQSDGTLVASLAREDATLKKFHGLARSLVANAVAGVTDGFKMVAAPAAPAERHVIRLFLKYGPHGEKVISGVERISRPGRRVYFRSTEVPPVLGGLGTSILTTSRGVMTGRAAVQAGVGGEVLCNIW